MRRLCARSCSVVGAAILGMILYATFEILTGIIIGYASLAVGWMVGKAMIKGSNGVGGRRYQIAAVLLTYAAVSPGSDSEYGFTTPARRKHQQQQKASVRRAPNLATPVPRRPRARVGTHWGCCADGLASPFLDLSDLPGGLIGLFILFVGLKFAWQFPRAAKPIRRSSGRSRTPPQPPDASTLGDGNRRIVA